MSDKSKTLTLRVCPETLILLSRFVSKSLPSVEAVACHCLEHGLLRFLEVEEVLTCLAEWEVSSDGQ